jgi:hypothetical protein
MSRTLEGRPLVSQSYAAVPLVWEAAAGRQWR